MAKFDRIGLRTISGIVLATVVAGYAGAEDIQSTVNVSELMEEKQTPLGLYLTSSDAAAALEASPGIVFFDVRDPFEVMFIGHPTSIDAVVPLEIVTPEFDAEQGGYSVELNPDFVAQVDAVVAREGAGKDSPVFVTCRSGNRSAAAAEALSDAGYTNVWNLVEGFEGDKDEAGVRSANGWRNAGLPWTYKLTADQAWVPAHEETE